METRAHHILIGLFTVIVVGAALAFALWLGKVDRDRQFHHYDVVFEEAVAGLSKGSTVEFNGIKIGEVDSLRLDPQDPRRVLARIRVDSEAPIRTDTRARLAPAGITGIYTIRLTSGDDPGSKPLRPLDGEVPVIVAEPSPLTKLMAEGGDVMLNVNELLIQARALFSSENAAAVGRTLQHLEQTAGTLAAQREDMGEALRQLALASAQANGMLAEARRMLGTTNRLLDDQGTQTLESAQRAMAAFEQTMQRVDGLVADNRSQFDSGMRGIAELGPAVSELRRTLASLHSITRQLENRPADYLLGLESTREFQP
ncbi:MlaD family protein [Pseudothauera rhizosphaerae]|uniref:MCE family protein n=1 Tax=Pseudothauera rhizosphaerae TaxID=2565932 RepID=A0A4V6RX47_9RHOO|nr:MlaD family protein [Pseudothauera rhizosphaerae]THF61710.1 MCE family protein [Pseudothauera rhizosphaerae]